MVLDSSAIVAILLKEPGHEKLIAAIDQAETVVVGAPTLLETAMVLTTRIVQDARPVICAFLRRLEAEVVAFNQERLGAATTASLRFGRGRHPAALILGFDGLRNRIGCQHAFAVHRRGFRTDRYRAGVGTRRNASLGGW